MDENATKMMDVSCQKRFLEEENWIYLKFIAYLATIIKILFTIFSGIGDHLIQTYQLITILLSLLPFNLLYLTSGLQAQLFLIVTIWKL